MKIYKIKLENYRQYRGEHILELSTDEIQNVNIILGGTGAGKTNLLNAINWCLYGDEPSLKKTSGRQQGIANEKELADKGDVIVRVGILMGDRQPEFYFERTVHISGSPINFEEHEKTWRASYFDSEWKSYNDLDWRNMTQFEMLRSSILPESIRRFFFFDGEKLNEFFRKGMEHEVEDAITKVCQIELLEKSITNLHKCVRKLTKGFRGASSEIERINEEIELFTKSKEELEKEIKKLNDEITEASNNKDDIDDRLREYSKYNVKELQKERDRLNSENEKLDKKIKEKDNEKRKHFALGFPSILCYSDIEKTYKLIDQRKKGIKRPRIPPDIRDKFINDLLAEKYCICGTFLPEGSPEREKLEKLRDSVESTSKISDIADDGYYKLDNILKTCRKFKSERIKLEEEYQELSEERKKNDQILKGISEQLEKTPEVEIQELEGRRNIFEDQIRRCIADRREKELTLKTIESKIEGKQIDLKKEIEKDKKQEKLRLKLDLCEKSIEALNEIKEKLVNKVQKEIDQKTLEYFLSLHWKKGGFKDVKINEKYELSLINDLGSECLGSISSGETQLLALSFMAALSSVSGFDAPVIIDTPLGRLAGVPKEQVAASLPKYLKNTQLTFLITDQEYTPAVRNNMKERIGKEFELKHDVDIMSTKIVESRG